MTALLPRFEIILPEKATLNLCDLFHSTPEDIWLEVGFGGGEHLAAQAKNHPSLGFIGCEPFVNGIASLLDHLDREAITNVRIYPDDARPLLDVLPDASIARCFVLFSDPWPKARHAERRFIGSPSLSRLERVLKPGAELCMATDHIVLGEHIREQMKKTLAFMCERDSTAPPPGWVQTRYEEKGIKAGRVPVYFSYRRT